MRSSMYDVTKESFAINPILRSDAIAGIRNCWQSIGHEFLVNEDGEPDETVVMDRNEVIECVLDANRLESFTATIDAAAYAIWAKWHNRNEWKLIVNTALPFARCGY